MRIFGKGKANNDDNAPDDSPTTVLPRVTGNKIGKAPARVERCRCGGKIGIMCSCAGTGTRTEHR